MGEGKEKPLNELLTASLVTIRVGRPAVSWSIHEKLLCARAQFFAKTFSSSSDKTYNLPDEDPEPFQAFVGWLYSAHTPKPTEEKDLDILYDLYLLATKFRARELQAQTMASVKKFYADSDTYPGLRRVQYVYANTEEGSAMRAMLVSAVARGLVLRGDGIPQHWDKALRKNGSLAVDLVRAVQGWSLNPDIVPDARVEGEDGSVSVKDEDEEEEDEDDDEEMTEDGEHELKAEDVKKEDLMGELPNGLVNGTKH